MVQSTPQDDPTYKPPSENPAYAQAAPYQPEQAYVMEGAAVQTGPAQQQPYQAYAVPVQNPGVPGVQVVGQPVVTGQPSSAIYVVHQGVTCRYCGHTGPVVTQNRGPGFVAWCWCFVLFLVFWPLCWLPFVIDACMDREIICSNCRRAL